MDTYFGPNKEKLLPKAHTLLDILANTMKGYPKSRWEINGYTDSTGIDKQNLEISKKAAQTVADYLIGKGVNPQMLNVKGYGERNPIFSNDFSEGRALNRRVEIKYVSGQ
jgi:outer membrane protein OmpA-like peptidoglycan-associated protein